MSRPGLDSGTLGLKEGSGKFLWSGVVGKVFNYRETRLEMSTWISTVRLVRGIKRGIFEGQNSSVSPPDITSTARRAEAGDAASHTNLDDRLSKSNVEVFLSSSANTISGSDLLNEKYLVLPGVASAPILLLTVIDAAKLLAVSRTKLYELLNSRAIDSVYIGRSRRIRLVDLETFVNGLDAMS